MRIILAFLISIAITLLAFYGVNGLFNPVIIVVQTLTLIFVAACIFTLIRSIFRAVIERNYHKVNLRCVLSISLVVTVCSVQSYVHEKGFSYKVRNNESQLTLAASEFIATHKDSEYGWHEKFNLWVGWIGPTRPAAWHAGGILYLDIEGVSGTPVGLCFNPKGIESEYCKVHLYSGWYRLHGGA